MPGYYSSTMTGVKYVMYPGVEDFTLKFNTVANTLLAGMAMATENAMEGLGPEAMDDATKHAHDVIEECGEALMKIEEQYRPMAILMCVGTMNASHYQKCQEELHAITMKHQMGILDHDEYQTAATEEMEAVRTTVEGIYQAQRAMVHYLVHRDHRLSLMVEDENGQPVKSPEYQALLDAEQARADSLLDLLQNGDQEGIEKMIDGLVKDLGIDGVTVAEVWAVDDDGDEDGDEDYDGPDGEETDEFPDDDGTS